MAEKVSTLVDQRTFSDARARKPSLICDLQEPFRHFIEDFIIEYIQELDPRDSFQKQGPRWFLTSREMKKYIMELNKMFDKTIEHQRIKKFGKRAKIRTIIKEEPIKLGQYLRNEKRSYFVFKVRSIE